MTDFAAEAKNDKGYIEMLSMALHQPPDVVSALLAEFALECRAKKKGTHKPQGFPLALFRLGKNPNREGRKEATETIIIRTNGY